MGLIDVTKAWDFDTGEAKPYPKTAAGVRKQPWQAGPREATRRAFASALGRRGNRIATDRNSRPGPRRHASVPPSRSV